MKSKWIAWVVVAVAVVAVGFLLFKPAASSKGVVNVDSAKVEQLLKDGNVHVVDVRTAGEFEAGHLTGAENVPVDQVGSVASSWDKSKPLLVYCATGARSSSAVSQLQSMGFATIYHLSQGLVSWQGALDKGAGTPVAQAPQIKTNGKPVMYEFFTDW
jgi:rhodanese-related sulfurtransferase